MEKFIMAHDTALRISDTEKGSPVLVLLHGYLESLEIWEEFARCFTPRCRVLAIDLPGHGISETKGDTHTMEYLADVLKGVLDKQGIARCFVAGHSMGGYVAEAFAARYPGMLQGLILLHSTPNADTDEKKENRRREIGLIREDKKELIAALFAPKGFAEENRRRLRDRIEQVEELISATDDDGIVAILNGLIARNDQNDMMRALKVPQLFVFGRHDEFIPAETAARIAAAHPQAEVAWLDRSGHMGFIEEPEATAEAIRSFIGRHDETGA